MKNARIKSLWLAISIVLLSGNAAAQIAPIDVDKARVADYWTSERKANAIPRDLVIDPRGLGYLRLPDRSLVPYGHSISAQATPRNLAISPFGQPGADTTPPTISNADPAAGATIGASKTFSATVTDASGVKSVTFRIQKVGSIGQSFSATKSAGDVWSVALSGFTDGTWNWSIDAKDNGSKGGNTATAGPFGFTVSTGGGGGGGGAGTITNDQWTAGGAVQNAAGRIYFEMPNNAQLRRWTAYVCSGTVATDSTTGRSVILTAAHCVYDDVNKAFARNVMFIPDQAGGGSKTDLNCSNDPMGCWIPSFGVVDVDWTNRTFPANIPWDYAFYVAADSGAHQGTTATSNALDSAAGSLPVSFDTPAGVFTHALGYSYSYDPKFMYCAEDRVTESGGDWWLGSCGLSGGSSGGPWVQPMTLSTGTGPIISVNSWGYTNSPGMAGPKLVATTAERIFCNAKSAAFFSAPDGAEGIIVNGASAACP